MQLDGNARRGHVVHISIDDWKDRRDVAADLDVLRPGIRALGGEYVCDSRRNDTRSAGLDQRLVGVEPDSGHPGKYLRRFYFYRVCPLRHLQKGCAERRGQTVACTRV